MDETAKSASRESNQDPCDPYPSQWWEKGLVAIILVGIVVTYLGFYFR